MNEGKNHIKNGVRYRRGKGAWVSPRFRHAVGSHRAIMEANATQTELIRLLREENTRLREIMEHLQEAAPSKEGGPLEAKLNAVLEEVRSNRNELKEIRGTLNEVHTSVTELKTHREHDEKRMQDLATKDYVKSQTWRAILTGVGLILAGFGLIIRFL